MTGGGANRTSNRFHTIVSKEAIQKCTFVVHVPAVLPDGVVVRAGRRPGGKVGRHTAHPLGPWGGAPSPHGQAHLAVWAERPEGGVVEVIDRTQHGSHLHMVALVVGVGLKPIGQTHWDVPGGERAEKMFRFYFYTRYDPIL